ncbi:Centromere protein T [Geodia barretti]|uniref:Centromere protein T n=1 Tax=Geodia barretti TaxID=519541 RepID=A0AA35RD34_GEOBA|nr:Centromere protein T [Geodia barretti]
MSSSRKRKRQTDDSFRQSFMELRDAGVPDTGPKRPRDKKIVSLTPASVTRARMEPRASGGKSRERRGRRGGRGRGRASPRGEIRIRTASSPIGPTPRTQLRNDIRDLINSAVELGDVMPAPPRTVLTPYQPTPGPSSRGDGPTTAVSNATQSTSTTVDTEMEVQRGAQMDSETESHAPPLASVSLADIVEETPTQESRVLRSALKGVHSLSSLQKKSLLSQTPHTVSFGDNITVAEYSPEISGRGSDFSLGSSTSSSVSTTPSPLPSRPHVPPDAAGDVSEPREPLEQLEDDDSMAEREEEEEEEEDEEEGEEEEEEDGVNVKMQTPHLLPRPPSPTSRQGTSQQSRGRRKGASKKTRKPKSGSPAEKVHPKPLKTLSRALIKNLFMLSGKRRATSDAAAMVLKFSEVYLKRCSNDLAEYASHAGRKTLEVDDVILLMKRQRFITESESFEYLVNTHLPLEYVEELLPCAVAGKKIVPTRVK